MLSRIPVSGIRVRENLSTLTEMIWLLLEQKGRCWETSTDPEKPQKFTRSAQINPHPKNSMGSAPPDTNKRARTSLLNLLVCRRMFVLKSAFCDNSVNQGYGSKAWAREGNSPIWGGRRWVWGWWGHEVLPED